MLEVDHKEMKEEKNELTASQKESAATTEKTEIVQPSSDISTIEPPAIIVDVSNLEKPVTTNDVEIATKQEAPMKGIVIEEDVDKKKAKKKQSATKKKRFIGVTYHKKNGRWVAQASEEGRSKYLGTYATAEKAAKVYDAYVISRFGPNSKTNFPKEDVDFRLVPVLTRYSKRDAQMNFVQFPHNPLFPVEQALFGSDYKQFKDPLRPKNPRNAYMMFVSEQRKLVKAGKITVPGNTLGQRSKFYGKQWKSLTTEDKKEFIESAHEDRKRFEKETEFYVDRLKNSSAHNMRYGMTPYMIPMPPMPMKNYPNQMAAYYNDSQVGNGTNPMMLPTSPGIPTSISAAAAVPTTLTIVEEKNVLIPTPIIIAEKKIIPDNNSPENPIMIQ